MGTQKSYTGFSNEKTITLVRLTSDPYPESAHDYLNSTNQTWSYSIPGAQALIVKFTSQTKLEGSSYDRLYITDVNGTAVGKNFYCGTQLSGVTLIVPGDTLNLHFTSDNSVVYYGFSFEYIAPSGQ